MNDLTSAWWRSYFDDVFFALHDPLFTEADSRHEVAAMLDMLGLPAGARVLDVPCGWGRHTELLRLAGFQAFGADLSPELLARATAAPVPNTPDDDVQDVESDALDVRDAVEPSAGRPSYAAADIRALPFAAACFDGAIDVFTSLGLFNDPRDDARALREIRRVLRPAGRFLLETMHRDDVAANYAERDAWSLPDGTEVRVRRRFDPLRGLSHEVLRWRRGDQQGEKRHTLRLRTATEVVALLRRAGFRIKEAWGDWSGETFRYDSPRLIVLAESRSHP